MANPRIKLISTGRYHLAALRDDNTVVFWGAKRAEFSHDECSNAQNVACGDMFTAIHKDDGSVILKPPFTGDSRAIKAMPEGTVVDKICAGDKFLACLQENTIVIYGAKFNGTPVQLIGPRKKGPITFVDVFCGPQFVMGLSDKGDIHAWGQAAGAAPPDLPDDLGPIKFAAATNDTIVVIKADDTLAGAGPAGIVEGEFKFVKGCGSYFIGIKTDNTVISWGQQKVALPGDLKATYVCGGAAYALCINMDDDVVSFGHGNYGETTVPLIYAAPKVFDTVEQMVPPDVILSLDPAANPVSIANIPTVSDVTIGGDVSVSDFLMHHQGNGCIFEHRGRQSGTTKSFIKDQIESGDAIFYKCLAKKNFNPPHERGTFEPDNVVNLQYVKLALNGTFYVSAKDALKLFSAHQFWRLVPTMTVLEFTCGHQAAVAGGPVVGSDHCQDGTQKRIHKLQAYVFGEPVAGNGAGNGAAPLSITLKRGETDTVMNVSKSRVVRTIKAAYAELLGTPRKKFRFFFGGQELGALTSVTPGSTIIVMDSAEGGRFTRKARR